MNASSFLESLEDFHGRPITADDVSHELDELGKLANTAERIEYHGQMLEDAIEAVAYRDANKGEEE